MASGDVSSSELAFRVEFHCRPNTGGLLKRLLKASKSLLSYKDLLVCTEVENVSSELRTESYRLEWYKAVFIRFLTRS